MKLFRVISETLQKRRMELVTCAEFLGSDRVGVVADRVLDGTCVIQFLILRGLEDLKDVASLSKGTPTVGDILFFFLHRAGQCDITRIVHKCY